MKREAETLGKKAEGVEAPSQPPRSVGILRHPTFRGGDYSELTQADVADDGCEMSPNALRESVMDLLSHLLIKELMF